MEYHDRISMNTRRVFGKSNHRFRKPCGYEFTINDEGPLFGLAIFYTSRLINTVAMQQRCPLPTKADIAGVDEDLVDPSTMTGLILSSGLFSL